MTRSSLRWPLLALVGLLVAGAIALVATQMVSQKIGISSEPLNAGRALAPRTHAPRKPPPARRTTSATTATITTFTPTPPPSPAPITPSAPSDGGGEGDD